VECRKEELIGAVMQESGGPVVDERRESLPVLSFQEVTKAFGPVVVVDHVSLDLREREIHALVGENGAGKSTLIRVLAGDLAPESGTMLLDGNPVSFAHPSEAIAVGIGCVHQLPMFVPNLSITENLLLGSRFERRRAGLIDWRAEHGAARASLAEVGLSVDPRQSLEILRPHERQLVAVARALRRGLRILVLDEVTASLSEPEVHIVHDVIRSLRDRGVTILYVSHRLEEIFRLVDRVTVLRDGKRVATLPIEGLTRKEVVRHIVGKELDHLFDRRTEAVAPSTAPRLSVRGLADARIREVSFDVHAGEILGIAGLGGSGRTRLLHMLFGAGSHRSGTILIDGEPRTFSDPCDALAAGVAMVTEDRQDDGYVRTLPIWQNVTLPWLTRFRRWGLLPRSQERATARSATTRLGVRMPSIEASMAELSGGNQQKVILARWTSGPIHILLLDEPTHGVDVRSKSEIYNIVKGLAGDGVAVVVVSSEFEEVEALCDRVLLLREGRIMGELLGRDIAKDTILHLLLSGGREAAA
jgi:ABC-type sugar transport system ATPase subunit